VELLSGGPFTPQDLRQIVQGDVVAAASAILLPPDMRHQVHGDAPFRAVDFRPIDTKQRTAAELQALPEWRETTL
jgi:hypothetical protein